MRDSWQNTTRAGAVRTAKAAKGVSARENSEGSSQVKGPMSLIASTAFSMVWTTLVSGRYCFFQD